MPPRSIEITAPSRLHFGMLSFGQPGERQFGGVGAMIDRPGLKLRMTRADRATIRGPLTERVAAILERIAATPQSAVLPVEVEVLSAPPEHVGLGVGTQLTLALVAGLNALESVGGFLRNPPCPVSEKPDYTAAELAQRAGRGERSAVGTYGFCHGGLLVEAGKLPGETLSPLVSRVALPGEWRFVLVRPAGEHGLSGDAERQTFAALPPVPAEVTSQLCREALLHLAPAAVQGRFDEFSESLYRYGYQAGLCFAANQGGPFASQRLARLIDTMRSLGVRGVGQSSWGPTLFALLPNGSTAAEFCERLRTAEPSDDLELLIAAPDNHGARIEVA